MDLSHNCGCGFLWPIFPHGPFLLQTRCVQEYIRRESCCLRESLGADIKNLLAHKPILFSSMPFQQDSRPAEQGEAVACTAGTAHFQTEQFMHSRVEHQRLEFPTLFAWMTPFFTISK